MNKISLKYISDYKIKLDKTNSDLEIVNQLEITYNEGLNRYSLIINNKNDDFLDKTVMNLENVLQYIQNTYNVEINRGFIPLSYIANYKIKEIIEQDGSLRNYNYSACCVYEEYSNTIRFKPSNYCIFVFENNELKISKSGIDGALIKYETELKAIAKILTDIWLNDETKDLYNLMWYANEHIKLLKIKEPILLKGNEILNIVKLEEK